MSFWSLALLASPLLAGCADDAPPPHHFAGAVSRAPHGVPSARSPAVVAAFVPAAQPPDALEAPDGLLAGAGQNAAAPSVVPLTGQSLPSAATPSSSDDALAQTSDTLAGSAPGQKMPTEHSHWLKGSIFNARVIVRVNGLFLGTFTSPQDRDITMKLRGGINTLTLAYTPLASTASAHLDILESEHDPPIPPLATFRSPLSAASPSAPLQTTTQTLTFLAR